MCAVATKSGWRCRPSKACRQASICCHTKPVTPEPLIKPTREAKRIDKEGQAAKLAEPADS